MTEYAEWVYTDTIKRLLMGWQPNHDHGELVKQWWHPYKPFNNIEEMTDEAFAILKEIERKIMIENVLERD